MEYELRLNARITEEGKLAYYNSDKEKLDNFKKNNKNRPVIIYFYATDDNKEGRINYYNYFVLCEFQNFYKNQGQIISKYDIDRQLRENSPIMLNESISITGFKKSIKDIEELNKEEWTMFMYDVQQQAGLLGFYLKDWI